MSKRQLILFLKELSREELEAQVIDVYNRFKNVKEFYDFSFNPNESKRYEESKRKIAQEYFPEGRRKAKKRRSVAQNIFKHLSTLEFNPELVADLMLFNLEIAQTYNADTPIRQSAFYKSMLKSFRHALVYIHEQGFEYSFTKRINEISEEAHQQNWENASAFTTSIKEILN